MENAKINSLEAIENITAITQETAASANIVENVSIEMEYVTELEEVAKELTNNTLELKKELSVWT